MFAKTVQTHARVLFRHGEHFLLFLLFLLPLSFVSKSTGFTWTLLLIGSVMCLIQSPINLHFLSPHKETQWLIYCLLACAVWGCTLQVWFGFDVLGFKKNTAFVAPLFAGWIGFCAVRLPPTTHEKNRIDSALTWHSTLLAGAGCAAVFIFTIAAIEIFYWRLPRAGLHFNPNMFGYQAALIACLLMGLLVFYLKIFFNKNAADLTGHQPSRLHLTFTLLGLLLAGLAALMSVSRGVVMGLLLALLSMAYVMRTTLNNTHRRRLAWSGGALLVCGVGVVLFFPNLLNKIGTLLRIDEAVNNLESARNGSLYTSLGYRWMAWQLSWHEISQHWLIGQGEHAYWQAIVRETSAQHLPFAMLKDAPHAHNDVLQTVLHRGLIGLLLLIGVIVSACRICARALKIDHARPFAISLLALLCVFLVFGVFDSVLAHARLSLFTFSAMGLMIGILLALEPDQQEIFSSN